LDVPGAIEYLVRDRIGRALVAVDQIAVVQGTDEGTVDADLVVQLTVDAMRVDRNAQTLRMTGREIVRYAGQAELSFTVVQMTTGQVMATGKASANRESDESLSDNVNADAWKREMAEEAVARLAPEVAAAVAKAAATLPPSSAPSPAAGSAR
jgi:hypothetical protein